MFFYLSFNKVGYPFLSSLIIPRPGFLANFSQLVFNGSNLTGHFSYFLFNKINSSTNSLLNFCFYIFYHRSIFNHCFLISFFHFCFNSILKSFNYCSILIIFFFNIIFYLFLEGAYNSFYFFYFFSYPFRYSFRIFIYFFKSLFNFLFKPTPSTFNPRGYFLPNISNLSSNNIIIMLNFGFNIVSNSLFIFFNNCFIVFNFTVQSFFNFFLRFFVYSHPFINPTNSCFINSIGNRFSNSHCTTAHCQFSVCR